VGKMKAQSGIYRFAACALVFSCLLLVVSVSYPAMKNMAVVVAADSNLPDLTMAEFTKLCKGAQKSWPDGRSFTLVLRDPTSPEMHVAVQKLFGVSTADAKTAIAKINEVRPLIKIVGSDEDVFRTVTTTPGAVGLVDVYSINSAVKVLHIDGKLPFDVGYAFK
jgi:ABC-type phosphate transport system substrate-binding protein